VALTDRGILTNPILWATASLGCAQCTCGSERNWTNTCSLHLQLFVPAGRTSVGRTISLPSIEVAFQNGLRLTVDFSRESWPYCRLCFQKLTILSTIWFQKLTNCRQSRFQTKKSQLLQLVDSRFFVDFAVDFSWGFSGKMEEFVQIASNKIFKIFHQSHPSTTWPIWDPATVDFSRESWPYCRLWFKSWPTVDFSKRNPATVDLSSKVDCRLQCLLSTVPPIRHYGRLHPLAVVLANRRTATGNMFHV
jgi:hypothetical protein